MSNITLPASVLPAGTGAQTSVAVPGTIADPPPRVLELANGSLVRGEVIGRDRQGHVLIKTHEGVLPVASKAQLPEGSQVTLQIRSHGAQLHISVLQVDGHAPHVKPGAGTAQPPGGIQPPGAAPPNPAPATPTQQPAAPPGPQAQTAVPPQATQPPLPAGATRIPGTVTHAPPAASSLPNGAVLQGAVLGSDGQGQLLVRTDVGTLAIATDANAKPGSQVSLQVRASTPSLGVVIALPDAAAKPGNTATAPTGGTTSPNPGAAAAPGLGHQGPTTDILNLGQVVQARVESQTATARAPGLSQGATTAPTAPAAAPQVAQGTGPLPAGGTPAPASAATPGPPGGTAPANVPAPPPQVALPAPGQSLLVRVIEVVPPPTGSATPTTAFQPTAQPSPGGTWQLSGQVVGATPQGQPLVETALGRVSLGLAADLPPGARVRLELPANLLTSANLTAPAADVLEPAQFAYRWPGLESALELLRGAEPAVAEALLSGQGNAPALPSPGPRLTSSLLFFLAALNGGDAPEWLGSLAGGQFARSLEERGRTPLLRQLAGELGQLGRLTESGGDWRLLAIPFADGHQVHPLRLFLRRDEHRSDDPERDRETATRFVLEVELTRLGDLQMDGLVRKARFDLILRTRRPLSPAMQRDIGEIFQAANEAAGVDGQIVFQSSHDWRPMPVGDDTLHLGEVVA